MFSTVNLSEESLLIGSAGLGKLPVMFQRHHRLGNETLMMVLDGFIVLGLFNSSILSVLVEAIKSEVDENGVFALHIERVISLQGLAFVAVCLPSLQ